MNDVIDIERQQQDRESAERRALHREVLREGSLGRFFDGLARLRRLASERPTVMYDSLVLTGKVCRLADGSIGQVAIHESDGEWVEVCVPA